MAEATIRETVAALDDIAHAARQNNVDGVNEAIRYAHSVDCSDEQIVDAVQWGRKTTPLGLSVALFQMSEVKF